MKIEKEEVLLREGIVVEKATVRDADDNVFPRYRVNRPDVAAVLLFNTDTQKIVLTRQFRYAVAAKVPESILEIVAGRLDPGETPEQAALRETEEEAGYRIRPEQLSLLVSCFASPGYSSERLNIYYAAVTDADKLEAGGGGLKSEHEQIELVELTTGEFRHLLQEGGIQDAKTYVAGLYVAFYRRNFL
ncbi:NUDIX domain-containing protein [Dawidia soli]|uniref:GDP-mannose pyrophosphatase n=1 Tax=Dawidia soli TaxID=2782352 RepID=A0AAP2DFC6_9BACT|nr:NUDIX hydrolase [Dawidia soli]MBT1690823.1 NUDIX hydrolase [Dawidia soli]